MIVQEWHYNRRRDSSSGGLRLMFQKIWRRRVHAALPRDFILDLYPEGWRWESPSLIRTLDLIHRFGLRIVAMPVRPGERGILRNFDKKVGIVVLAGANRGVFGMRLLRPILS